MLLLGAYDSNIMGILLLGAIFLLIGGESLLLLLGMNFPRPGKWSTPLNVLLALSDIAGSAYVLIHQFQIPEEIFWLVYWFLIVTHFFRILQYAFRWGQPFCANFPLFVLNLLRLGGLVLAPMMIMT